jgi:hypothetical protein
VDCLHFSESIPRGAVFVRELPSFGSGVGIGGFVFLRRGIAGNDPFWVRGQSEGTCSSRVGHSDAFSIAIQSESLDLMIDDFDPPTLLAQ